MDGSREDFKVPSLSLSELEALGLSGLQVQERELWEFTRAELVSNNVNTKQVFCVEAGGDEITQRSSVFAVHSAVGSREVPDHKS